MLFQSSLRHFRGNRAEACVANRIDGVIGIVPMRKDRFRGMRVVHGNDSNHSAGGCIARDAWVGQAGECRLSDSKSLLCKLHALFLVPRNRFV
jgi:hypothetical protein